MKGFHHSEATKKILSDKFKIIAKEKGFGLWMKGKKNKKLAELNSSKKGKTYKEIYGDRAEEEALKRRESNRNRWIGKVKCDKRPQIIGRCKYRTWRESVFKRDNWQCQECKTKGYMEAHHIKEWSKYPELRYVIENGITLCVECHKKKRVKIST